MSDGKNTLLWMEVKKLRREMNDLKMMLLEDASEKTRRECERDDSLTSDDDSLTESGNNDFLTTSMRNNL